MSAEDNDNDTVSICANCGREGNDVNNVCNKCKMVKYCNAACKKKHRHKHKQDCEEHIRLAAKRAAELHDEKLFKEPPIINEDCPICFVRLPSLDSGWKYMPCCGKVICNGCAYAPIYDNQGNEVDSEKCPFCRTPWPESNEEGVKRGEKRIEVGDAQAMLSLGRCYHEGTNGFRQDYNKAFELWHRAAELGLTRAYCSVGYSYEHGEGVERNKKKANYYFELGAMEGDVNARYNLGNIEEKAGNMNRALKHFMIAVRAGDNKSLDTIKELYSDGYATKEDYMKALQSYQVYLGEIKSAQRDKAAATREDCRYY